MNSHIVHKNTFYGCFVFFFGIMLQASPSLNQQLIVTNFGYFTPYWYIVYIYIYNVRPQRQLSWFITPITMVYGTQVTIVAGAYKPTYNWGASHCIYVLLYIIFKQVTLFKNGRGGACPTIFV